MNKIFIPLFLIFILVFSITYFVNAQDEPQESPVTGFFQTQNQPPGVTTGFAIKDFWSVGSGTVYDNGFFYGKLFILMLLRLKKSKIQKCQGKSLTGLSINLAIYHYHYYFIKSYRNKDLRNIDVISVQYVKKIR